MTARKTLILAATISILAAQPAQAAPHSFEGTCAIVGVATLDHPLTVLPSPNHVVFRGEGTCSGLLDARLLPAGGAPVEVLASGDKLTGCTNTVVPELDIAISFYPEHGRKAKVLHATAQVTFTGPQMVAAVEGATGGRAYATGTVQGGAELLDQCLAGKLSAIGLSQDMRTLGPITG